MVRRLQRLRSVSSDRFPWERWEKLIEKNGIEIDRPIGSKHPDHSSIVYPIDYGFIPDTIGTDGQPVDIFRGVSESGLVALIITEDHRKNDREFKLIYDCSPREIYLVNGFINFDRSLMEGELVLRRPMVDLW